MTELYCEVVSCNIARDELTRADIRLSYVGRLEVLMEFLARVGALERPGALGMAMLRAPETKADTPPPIVASIEAGQAGLQQAATQKPPAQVVAPAGAPPGLVAGAGIAADVNKELYELVNSPWFQQYCRETTKSDISDDLKLAIGVVKMQLLENGKTWGDQSPAKFEQLKRAYGAWCETKGYRN